MRDVSQQDTDLADSSLGSTTDRRAGNKVKRLSSYEKSIIARRAYGEYAIDEVCSKIWRTHNRKNRNSDDRVYLEFMRVVYSKKAHTYEEYESAATPIMEAHPDPWGTADYKVARAHEERRQTPRRQRTRRVAAPPPPPPEKKKKKDTSTGLLVDESGMVWLPPDWDL